MKRMTKNNFKKVTDIFINKGYDFNTAENMAINAFCVAQQFGEDVEYCIRNISDNCGLEVE